MDPEASARTAAFAGMFESVQGLRNGKALAAMVACTVAGVLLIGLLMATVGRAFGPLAPLLALIVWFVAAGTGVNAAGLLHMDHARGISPRGLADALMQGLACIPKLIVLVIGVLLVEIAVFIVIAVLLFICRFPWLGPLLYTVVFPLSVVAAGITVTGLFLALVLSLPAIWQGAAITRALAQTFAIVRSRHVETVLLLFVVGVLSFAVGIVVFGVLASGLLPVIGMSASIVGFGGASLGGMGGLAGMASGLGGGHAVAGAIGGMVLWAIAASLVAQVGLLGLCIAYLRVTEGLDLTGAEEMLRNKLDEARRRTAELGDRARAAATRDHPSPEPHASAGFAPGEWDTGSAAAAVTAASAAAPAPVTTVPGYAHMATPVDETGRGVRAAAADIDIPLDPAVDADPDVTIAPQRSSSSRSGGPATSPPTPASGTASPPSPPAATQAFELSTCPQCLSPVPAEDIYCGVCGYRVR